MKIQKINSNINFRKNENKNNHILDCKINEYSENGEDMISFSFKKDKLFKFLKDIPKKFGFRKNKNNELNLQIDTNVQKSEEQELESAIFVAKTIQQTPQKTIQPSSRPFPTPKFTSDPTPEEADEYAGELLEFFNKSPDNDAKLKALKEIEKYGIKDIDYVGAVGFDTDDERITRETLKIYQKYGRDRDAYSIIGPIRRTQVEIKEEETYIEILKTLQKLAHLENDTLKDREIVLEPVRRLLDHENENIRKMAQETLGKME